MRLVRYIICLTLLISPPAFAADSENEELQSLIDQLKTITGKARQQRAADRWLLNDLEDLVARFDWPWRDELLTEDFSDGDFKQDPQWIVRSGQFWIDGRLGLRSRTQPAEVAPRKEEPQKKRQKFGDALLGALLKEALREEKQEREPEREPEERPHETAEIQLALAIPKVFAAHFEFSIHNRPSEEGQLVLGILQEERGSYGYQITITTGRDPFIELALLRRGRSQIIDSTELDNLNDGNSHTLDWRRDSNGELEVLLDETSLLKARNNTFKNAFRWLSIANHSGDFALSTINLQGGK